MPQSSRLSLLVVAIIIAVEFAASFCTPLLPLIRQDFVVDEYWVQMCVSFYLLGLGSSALCYGPLSDVWGRRPTLLFGLGLFCLASLLCVWAPTIIWLIIARFLQGAGAGVAWTVGNAALKDVTKGHEYTKAMNMVHIVAGFVPTVAPILGSLLGVLWGWRPSFFVVFSLSLATFLLLWCLLRESIPQRSSLSVKSFLKSYTHLARQPIYCRYVIVKVLMAMLIFVDAANLALIFVEHLGVPLAHFGYYITGGFLLYMAGGWLCHHFVASLGNDRLIYCGLAGIFSSTIVLLVALELGLSSALWMQFIRLPLYLGWGLIFGNATACIVAPFPNRAGAASAMMIALEMLMSFSGVYLCSLFYDGTLLPLASFALIMTVIALIGFYGLRQHRIADAIS